MACKFCYQDILKILSPVSFSSIILSSFKQLKQLKQNEPNSNYEFGSFKLYENDQKTWLKISAKFDEDSILRCAHQLS